MKTKFEFDPEEIQLLIDGLELLISQQSRLGEVIRQREIAARLFIQLNGRMNRR